jgi:hypothetical protein
MAFYFFMKQVELLAVFFLWFLEIPRVCSLNIAIDNMGVKVALRLNGEGFKDQEVQSVQNSGASTNKLAEKPRRSKGMEKSVLDDIMGDPDDFGDLGDLDAGSESDGGRWEDTLKTE